MPESARNRHILVAAIGLLILFGLPLVVDLVTLLEVSIYVVYAILALSLGFIWGYGGILASARPPSSDWGPIPTR